MIDDGYISDSEHARRFAANDPHDFGSSFYDRDEWLRNLEKLSGKKLRLAPDADPRDPAVAKAVADEVVRAGMEKIRNGGGE